MENASKAIIMAGGILIALIIISTLVILFNQITNLSSEQSASLTIEQLEEYNRKFEVYNNTSGLYGSELLSLANLIVDYDNRLLYDVDTNSDYYKENKIVVYVYINRDVIGYTSSDDGKIYGELKARKTAYPISEIKACNDTMEEKLKQMEKEGNDKSSDYQNIKSSLTELRSLSFRCTRNGDEGVKYNKYGRISIMYFTQS